MVNPDDVTRAEHDENVVRKDFLPSEMVAIRDALFPAEKEKAKEGQGECTDRLGEDFPQVRSPRNNVHATRLPSIRG